MHNSDWQTFLETQGAQIEDGIAQNFGSAADERCATRDGTVLCDLSQFGILKVSGEDAQSFLHNLCSNDIKAITPNLAQLNSLNTAKGRVLATFLVWQNGTEYFLHLPISLLAPIQKKLSMYVLRAKVKIEDVSEQILSLGLAGAKAETLIKEHIGSTLEAPMSIARCTHFDGQQQPHFITIRLDESRFQIITMAQHAPALWKKLCAEARPVGSPCWDWLNIRAGIPVILLATQEQFVLQMLNLDLLGGVSFKKGCYPGQEIVARMHYLGKLKQRTFLAHVASDVAPQPNDALYSDDFAGQSSGSILNSASAPQGGYDVLATLQISSVADSQIVHWKTPDGVALGFQALPYDVPTQKAA